MWSQRNLVCLRSLSCPASVRALSSLRPLLARSKTQKLLPPEERLVYLRTGEKRVAIFAGVSVLIGCIALKSTFSKLSTKREEKMAAVPKEVLPRPLVLAGPSGSGKSTMLTRLFKETPDKFGFSVSHTTRKPREGEVNGKQYHFTTREAMQKEIDAGDFIEWAEYSGNMYGTSKKAVRDVQKEGKVCVLDIDMQGVRSLKKTDLNPVYVLIRPPSLEVLEERLRSRKTETEDSLKRRLAVAKEELSYGEEPGVFNHVVVNDKLEEAYTNFIEVIKKYVDLENKDSKSA